MPMRLALTWEPVSLRAQKISSSLRAKSQAGWVILKEASAAWMDDNAPSLGAALAFYTIFSLAPVLIITTAIAGLVFGRQAVESHILEQVQGLAGHNGAAAIRTIIRSLNRPGTRILASTFGIAAVLAGASGAFLELQNALNKIWRVPARSESFWLGAIRQRASSFGLVLATGILLMVSLALSAALAAMGKFMGHMLPAAAFVLLQCVNFIASVAVITLLFAMIYKVLPDTKITWNDVWIGAAATSFLFTVGKLLIGLYLGRSTVGSLYGAAGSLVLLLVWIYYSAQLLLLGAEVTHIYARKHGSRAGPAAPGQTAIKTPVKVQEALARARAAARFWGRSQRF